MPENHSTIYKAIEGFPGYRIGNDGSVWTCKKRGGSKQWFLSDEWRLMKPRLSNKGYFRIGLLREGKSHWISVHSLVLEHFTGPRPEGMVARHLNSIRTDNRHTNLEWSTQSENLSDRKEHGTETRGERNGLAKLTDESVREIRRLAREGAHLKTLGERFDVSDALVYEILRRKIWTHIDPDEPPFETTPLTERRGEDHPNSKLTNEQTEEIRLLASSGLTQRQLAERFGVSQACISYIVTKKRRSN